MGLLLTVSLPALFLPCRWQWVLTAWLGPTAGCLTIRTSPTTSPSPRTPPWPIPSKLVALQNACQEMTTKSKSHSKHREKDKEDPTTHSVLHPKWHPIPYIVPYRTLWALVKRSELNGAQCSIWDSPCVVCSHPIWSPAQPHSFIHVTSKHKLK